MGANHGDEPYRKWKNKKRRKPKKRLGKLHHRNRRYHHRRNSDENSRRSEERRKMKRISQDTTIVANSGYSNRARIFRWRMLSVTSNREKFLYSREIIQKPWTLPTWRYQRIRTTKTSGGNRILFLHRLYSHQNKTY